MTLDSASTLFLLLAFAVPGLVIEFVRSQFITGRVHKGPEKLLHYLTLSAVNYAVFSWAIYLAITSDYLARHDGLAALTWLLVILVGPAFLGVLSGYNTQRGWLRRLFQHAGLQPVHVMPTAWDWQFSRLAGSNWVLVTMQDGSTVAGLFGGQSFASSDPAERDIYIEQVYDYTADGEWHCARPGHSILVMRDEIRFVEFFRS